MSDLEAELKNLYARIQNIDADRARNGTLTSYELNCISTNPKPLLITVKKDHVLDCICHRPTKSEKENFPPWKFIVDSSNTDAIDFLSLARSESPPEWIHPLPVKLPPIPESLTEFMTNSIRDGVEHASHVWLQDRITRPPKDIWKYVSGTSDKAQRFQDYTVGSFFASLFHIMQLSSCTNIELTGWDLYHGHMFMHAINKTELETENQNEIECELGILFHAKEFPMEYRASNYSPVYPIGHPKGGGDKDPRMGTKISTEDVDFHLRNYIWLYSTNKLYLLDPKAPGFDKRILCRSGGDEYHTCSWSYFTNNLLGDINYFPSLFSQTEMGHLYYKAIMQSRKIMEEHKEYIGSSPRKILESKLNDSLFCWYVKQVGNFIRHSKNFSLDLFFCPRIGFSAAIQLFDAFKCKNPEEPIGMTKVSEIVSIMKEDVLKDILEIFSLVDEKSKTNRELLLCEKKVKDIFCTPILDLIFERKKEIQMKKEKYNEEQFKQVLEKNIDPNHAKLALSLTSFDGYHSSYKSLHLLSASYGKYREIDDIKQFGDEDYPMEEVHLVMKQTFYGWSTLYAMKLQREEGHSFAEAVVLAQQAAVDKLEKSLIKSLEEHNAKGDKNEEPEEENINPPSSEEKDSINSKEKNEKIIEHEEVCVVIVENL